ncbi:hypothetical protein [Actinophytocola sp.]|uniref:hypothetical protein n=1 Tax=Actinophytocola sp. TaxID=1872138 RepID=UPI003D6BAFFD
MTVPDAAADVASPAVERPRRHPVWAYVAAGLGVPFVVGVWAAWFFTIDDAFITFRYADNLAAGHGPVWNAGEDPVEGFTNFLWMLWHTPFAWLGADLPTVAKLTSLAAGAAILVMLVRHCHQRGGLVAALVAGGAFVVFLPTYFHLTSGLETVAFAAVVVRAVIVGLRAVESAPVRAWEPSLLVLVAGMLRPEGVLAALPAFAAWLWLARRDRRAWLWSAGAAVAGLGYVAWRWSFYGHPFPNTFYVKVGGLRADQLWLETTATALAPLLVLTAFLLVRRETRRAGALLCATVVTTYATYALSGPTMDYLYRFAYHAFPVLCLGAGLAAGSSRSGRPGAVTGSVTGRVTGAVAGAVAAGWVAVTGIQAPDFGVIANYGPDLARAHIPIGHGLARADVPAERRTLAVGDAGAIPYHSGWRTIDYIGLNDEPVAHGADVTARVADARPTVIVIRSITGAVPRTVYGMNVAEVTRGYEFVAGIRMRADYATLVYVLPRWADEVRGPVLAAVGRAQRTHDPGRYENTVDRWLDRIRHDLPW